MNYLAAKLDFEGTPSSRIGFGFQACFGFDCRCQPGSASAETSGIAVFNGYDWVRYLFLCGFRRLQGHHQGLLVREFTTFQFAVKNPVAQFYFERSTPT